VFLPAQIQDLRRVGQNTLAEGDYLSKPRSRGTDQIRVWSQ
jgi:hypothetical protein